MSHSQFRRTKTYTETCMDESLRQAYDYWQDQPGSSLSCHTSNSIAFAQKTSATPLEILDSKKIRIHSNSYF